MPVTKQLLTDSATHTALRCATFNRNAPTNSQAPLSHVEQICALHTVQHYNQTFEELLPTVGLIRALWKDVQ